MEGKTYFENLRECFHDFRIFVTIHLNNIDEGDLGFGALREGLKNGCMFLKYNVRPGGLAGT